MRPNLLPRSLRWLVVFVLGSHLCGHLKAYEVHFAKTGYPVTSGMNYAIHYELKQLIARHEQAFQRKAPTDFKITYRIFPTYEQYKAYSAKTGRTVTRDLLGYTESEKSVIPDTGDIVAANAEVVSWKHPEPAELLATVLHETAHAVTQAFLLRVPLWMDEGSADWFGKPVWADGQAQKLDRAHRWQTLQRLLDRKQLPPLRAYLEADDYSDWARQFDGDIGLGYVIGYSLFDFFMSQASAQSFLTSLLKHPAIEKGAKPGAVFTAQLDKRWRGGLPAFERGWHNWIRRKAALEKPSDNPKTPAKR